MLDLIIKQLYIWDVYNYKKPYTSYIYLLEFLQEYLIPFISVSRLAPSHSLFGRLCMNLLKPILRLFQDILPVLSSFKSLSVFGLLFFL